MPDGGLLRVAVYPKVMHELTGMLSYDRTKHPGGARDAAFAAAVEAGNTVRLSHGCGIIVDKSDDVWVVVGPRIKVTPPKTDDAPFKQECVQAHSRQPLICWLVCVDTTQVQ